MRVLIVYQHLPHYRLGVFRELDNSPSFEFTFAAGDSSRDESIPSIAPGTLKREVALKNYWIGPLLWQGGLVNLLRRNEYDRVVFLGDASYLSTWVSALTLRLRGIPVYFWTIGWHAPDVGVKKYLRLLYYRLASLLLLYGEDARELGLALGYPSSRMRVIGNSHDSAPLASREASGSDSNMQQPAKRSFMITDEALRRSITLPHRVVAAVVRLNAEKRLDLLIEAAAMLGRQGKPVELLLVGDGPTRPGLEALTKRLGVHSHFLGAVYDEAALSAIYRHVKLTVIPERAGLTVIQSLSHGRPVITVDNPYKQVPEFRAVIPGQTGDLYPDGDMRGLSTLIDEWLTRLAYDERNVARACVSEVASVWNAHSHARRILDALRAETP